MQKRLIPEVLAPAGNLEKLKTAINYGANAVYAAGQNFSLRSAADNFTNSELIEGVNFAHNKNAKIYVVLNSLLHDKEIVQLPEFVKFLHAISVDGVIVSDLGVLSVVQRKFNLPIHLSTQASCLNISSALLYKEIGVKRLILGREVSIKEAGEIKRATGLEVELFVHGSMCMAYSGNCVISNYTKGRDSNRGGCAHSCRFSYDLRFKNHEQSKAQNCHFMSSKDLMGLDLLPQFVEHEIDSIKIEGRMKSSLYTATTTKAYSQALRELVQNGQFSSQVLESSRDLLSKIVHRDYTQASLLKKAGPETLLNEISQNENQVQEYPLLGNVLEVKAGEYLVLQMRNNLDLGENIEILAFDGPVKKIKIKSMTNFSGEQILQVKPNMLVKLPFVDAVMAGNIVRKEVNLC